MKAISLGATAFKSIAPKLDAFLDATRVENNVAIAAGVKAPGMETMENFAVAGKVAKWNIQTHFINANQL